MPEQERQDFEYFWGKSLFDENGNVKNPGGEIDNNGVDYFQNLILFHFLSFYYRFQFYLFSTISFQHLKYFYLNIEYCL